MTGADFTGVDIDLLADYLGGALDGTPEAARVAALIADDPAWRDAHAELRDGMADVGDALSGWGATPEPMPADVVARLDAALGSANAAASSGAAGEAAVSGTAGEAAVSSSPAETITSDAASETNASGASGASGATSAPAGGTAAGRHLTVVRETGVDREFGRRASIRRRALRWGASTAAAAAVLAFAGVGIAYLKDAGEKSSSDSSAAGSAMSGQAESDASIPGAADITSSDRDYGPSNLAAGADEPFRAPDAGALSPAPPHWNPAPTSPMMSDKSMADPLARLRSAEALQSCLNAIGAENAAGRITVLTVDYARFSGRPALVVHFTAQNGRWAWASGPDCGVPSAGADTAYSVKVG